MKRYFTISVSLILLAFMLLMMGCNQIPMLPIRNPLSGPTEPKLAKLPRLQETQKVRMAKIAWSKNALAKQERYSKLTPLIEGDTMYAADSTGKVVALNRYNGRKIWSKNTHHPMTVGPSVIEDKLFLASSDANIIALDKQNGKVLWKSKVSSEVLACPTGIKNILLVHAIDGSVSAFDNRTGERLWQVDQSTPALTLRFNSAPLVIGDKVLVGFATGKLIALNLYNGLIEWERVISIPRGRSELQRMVDISADPIVVGNEVYVITYQGKLAAVNITSGDLIWERDVSSYHNMAIKDDTLFITDNAHCLWAIDRHQGATLWKQSSLTQRYITGPVVVDNLVAVGDRGGYLHFISPEKGTLLERLHLSGKIYQDPIARENHMFVKTHRGKIAAIQVKHQEKV